MTNRHRPATRGTREVGWNDKKKTTLHAHDGGEEKNLQSVCATRGRRPDGGGGGVQEKLIKDARLRGRRLRHHVEYGDRRLHPRKGRLTRGDKTAEEQAMRVRLEQEILPRDGPIPNLPSGIDETQERARWINHCGFRLTLRHEHIRMTMNESASRALFSGKGDTTHRTRARFSQEKRTQHNEQR